MTRPSAPAYDAQAEEFDRRAGLPEPVSRAVAQAVLELAEAGREDLVVELGPGTGQLGSRLAAGARYVGLDASVGMLARFRRRIAGARLVAADGAAPWPLARGAARALFSSRAAHLIDARHLAGEAARLVSPAGGAVIVGRVERPADSRQRRLARELRRRLELRGLAPANAARHRRELVARLVARGGRPLGRRVVARWPVRSSAAEQLAAWRGKPGLAGLDPPAALKRDVLAEIEAWAAGRRGGLEAVETRREAYVLDGVRFEASVRGSAADDR